MVTITQINILIATIVLAVPFLKLVLERLDIAKERRNNRYQVMQKILTSFYPLYYAYVSYKLVFSHKTQQFQKQTDYKTLQDSVDLWKNLDQFISKYNELDKIEPLIDLAIYEFVTNLRRIRPVMDTEDYSQNAILIRSSLIYSLSPILDLYLDEIMRGLISNIDSNFFKINKLKKIKVSHIEKLNYKMKKENYERYYFCLYINGVISIDILQNEGMILNELEKKYRADFVEDHDK